MHKPTAEFHAIYSAGAAGLGNLSFDMGDACRSDGAGAKLTAKMLLFVYSLQQEPRQRSAQAESHREHPNVERRSQRWGLAVQEQLKNGRIAAQESERENSAKCRA
jgi:hypothetical protein